MYLCLPNPRRISAPLATALAVAFGAFDAIAQTETNVPSESINNINNVAVELTYTVESGTIAAGAAAGNVTYMRLNDEELAALGFDSTNAIRWADIENVDTNDVPDFTGLVFRAGTNGMVWVATTNDYAGGISRLTSNTVLGIMSGTLDDATMARVVYGGSRWVDAYFNADTMETVKGLGGTLLQDTPFNSIALAPAVAKNSGTYLPGFSQYSWQDTVTEPFLASDFLPRLSTSEGPAWIRLIARAYNDKLLPSLDSFFEVGYQRLLWLRRFVMMACLYVVGRRLVVFSMRVGPVFVNCIVNVLTNGALKDEIKLDED